MKHLCATVLLILLPLGAFAQGNCGPHDRVLNHFIKTYGAVISGRGVSKEGEMFEVLVDEETGRWVLISTNGFQIACIRVLGEAWHVPAPEPEEGPAN